MCQVYYGRDIVRESEREKREQGRDEEYKEGEEYKQEEKPREKSKRDVVFARKPRRSAGVTFILTRFSSLLPLLLSPFSSIVRRKRKKRRSYKVAE